jgi:hypothetical protein
MKLQKLLFALCVVVLALPALAQRRQPKPQVPRVCGDPTVKCKTDAEFKPHQLPFAVKFTLGPIQETELFYAVVVSTLRVKENECEKRFITEAARLALQKEFPRHKVFTDRCPEPDELYYTGFDYKTRIMAIYAGKTRAEADKILAKVKDRYPAAAVKRMRAGFNGT